MGIIYLISSCYGSLSEGELIIYKRHPEEMALVHEASLLVDLPQLSVPFVSLEIISKNFSLSHTIFTARCKKFTAIYKQGDAEST